MALVSPMRGWALCVGQPGVGNQAKAIFETSNGGRGWRLRAWASIFARGRGGLGTGGYPQGIAFGRAGRGLLWESRGALFLTKDGGRNWRVAGLTRYDVDFGQSASVAANDRYYVLLQTNGRFRLVTTHDSGAHWRTVHRWG